MSKTGQCSHPTTEMFYLLCLLCRHSHNEACETSLRGALRDCGGNAVMLAVGTGVEGPTFGGTPKSFPSHRTCLMSPMSLCGFAHLCVWIMELEEKCKSEFALF